MDNPHDHEPQHDSNAPPLQSVEAEVRTMLEQSRRDIVGGRTSPLEPVLDRMRATAQRMRSERTQKSGHHRHPA
jgi:hypothetical protein